MRTIETIKMMKNMRIIENHGNRETYENSESGGNCENGGNCGSVLRPGILDSPSPFSRPRYRCPHKNKIKKLSTPFCGELIFCLASSFT